MQFAWFECVAAVQFMRFVYRGLAVIMTMVGPLLYYCHGNEASKCVVGPLLGLELIKKVSSVACVTALPSCGNDGHGHAPLHSRLPAALSNTLAFC
jgi:hypothetical protein